MTPICVKKYKEKCIADMIMSLAAYASERIVDVLPYYFNCFFKIHVG